MHNFILVPWYGYFVILSNGGQLYKNNSLLHQQTDGKAGYF